MPADRPPFVVRAGDVPEHEGRYPEPFDAEALGLGRDLGRALGTRTLGAWLDRLPPGRRTSFTHAHLREEELVYVIDGAPTLRWLPVGGDPGETLLAPGDVVSFPAGTGIAHAFVNRSDRDAVLWVVGERRPGERIAYPEDGEFEAWRVRTGSLRVWRDRVAPVGEGTWPPYRIETGRLVLRPWEPIDAADLVAAIGRNHDHLTPFMIWARQVPTLSEQLARIRSWRSEFDTDRDLIFGVFLPDGRPIGGTGMHDRIGESGIELGYWLDHAHQGQGLVTEWCAALVRLAFEVKGLDRVEIHCDPRNERSAAVARRLGFTHEVTLERRTPGTDGRLRASMVWTLYDDQLGSSPAARVPVRAWDGAGRRLL